MEVFDFNLTPLVTTGHEGKMQIKFNTWALGCTVLNGITSFISHKLNCCYRYNGLVTDKKIV